MEQWQASLLVIGILWLLFVIIIGSLIAFYMCKDNNKMGILLLSITLPIIGTILSLIYMQKKHKIFNKKIKET